MKITSIFLFVCITTALFAQTVTPDISKIKNGQTWKVYNRNAFALSEDSGVSLFLDSRQGDGLAVYEMREFENGTIEFDVKGKDVLQRSFVGVAFHIQDEETFNAIYFRPFNFKKPERAGHSVQYICHPEFTWSKLRNDFPEQFENPVNPVPNPEDFFHAKIIVEWPKVKVFVEDSGVPSLEVIMKSEFKKGKIGFWVGNGSDGIFKNLVVKQTN